MILKYDKWPKNGCETPIFLGKPMKKVSQEWVSKEQKINLEIFKCSICLYYISFFLLTQALILHFPYMLRAAQTRQVWHFLLLLQYIESTSRCKIHSRKLRVAYKHHLPKNNLVNQSLYRCSVFTFSRLGVSFKRAKKAIYSLFDKHVLHYIMFVSLVFTVQNMSAIWYGYYYL